MRLQKCAPKIRSKKNKCTTMLDYTNYCAPNKMLSTNKMWSMTIKVETYISFVLH